MRILALLLLLLTPLAATAQDATLPDAPATVQTPAEPTAEQTERDRSYLTGLIEDNLSGAGRTIRLEGFKGALSSRATFDTLTIADDEGVWLTIRNGALAWDRTAILTGRIKIGELSADEIDLPRLPVAAASSAPSPEAKPFSLPELPVSVEIGALKAQKVVLGAPVLGEEVTLAVNGAMSLAGGEGSAKLDITRSGGPKGKVSFNGSFANASRALSIDLLVDEGKDGIVSKLAGLPGTPALTLAVAGSGTLDAFSADTVLSTEGAPRLTGKVTLSSAVPAGAPAGSTPVQGFSALLGGDITPLLPPEYHDFFGTQSAISVAGERAPSGALSLTSLSVDSEALSLSGQLDLLPSGLPARFDLTAKLGLASGAPVLLPVSGGQTFVQTGTVSLAYDSATSDGWKLDARLEALAEPTAKVQSLRLAGSGRIGTADSTPTAGGTLTFTANGIEMADPALASAVGPFVTGRTVFFWQKGKPLRLPALKLIGRDLSLSGLLTLDNLSGGVDVTADLDARAAALSNFAALAGQPLSGAAEGKVKGSMTLLTGAFDIETTLTGQDIKTGVAEADALLAGTSVIEASAKRDEAGLLLRSFHASAGSLDATASGMLSTGKNDLTAKITLPDLAVLGRGYRGALNATARVSDVEGAREIGVEAVAKNLATGRAEIDRILAGESRITLLIDQKDGRTLLKSLDLATPQLTAKASGTPEGAAQRIALSARLANAALLAPGFAGPVTLAGTVTDTGKGYGIDLKGTGPGGTQAAVTGSVAADFASTDLKIAGTTETALVNTFISPRSVQGPLRFDLQMKGAPGLQALSGRITGTDLRLTAPTFGLVLQNIGLRADLAGGRMQLALDGALKAGGTLALKGPVTLSAPYAADLTLSLDGAHLRDPELYDTRVSGALRIAGPMTGGAKISGALTLAETELRVPSTGLGGAAAIPDITHLHESAATRATRARAGLLQQDSAGGSGSSRPYALDVTISAPKQIFVRGRGLDAELGGALRLTGTTANIVPIGQFSLIRGRLDVLAKRFTLSEGQVAMQGALVPWILFSAVTEQDDYTITLTLEGDASAPELKISSSPDLPEEEVLARLLFNRGLTNLSPLQAAQLASAVASLAGKGGEGIVAKLRQGFGLDDLDIGTDASGNATLRAGKYLSENIYTDVEVESSGSTAINLNLDLSSHLTARGSVDSTGDSSLGLYFEKDY